MPRRKQQFSFLKRALRANAEGTPGGKLKEFQNFQKGLNKRNAGVIPPDARKRVRYGLYPFAMDQKAAPEEREFFVAYITKFSNDWRAGKTISNTELGYEAGKGTHTSSAEYYPAICRVAVRGAGALKEITSGITKEKYKKMEGSASYSIPFGAACTKTEANSYIEQRNLLTAAMLKAGASSVGFEPERWNKEKAEGGTMGT